MFALDLFNTVYERALNEGAVDDLEARYIHGLNTKMLDLLTRAKNANPEMKATLKREYDKIKSERDSFFKIRTEEGGIPGNVPVEKIPGKEDLLKGKGRSYYEEDGIPGSVPADKIPGKEDLLKGKGRSYYEADQKKNSEDQKLARLKVQARRQFPQAATDDEALMLALLDKEAQDDRANRRTDARQDADIKQNFAFDQEQEDEIHTLQTQAHVNEHGGGIGPRQHWQDLMQERKLNVGDPIIVTAANEFEGATGEIHELSPSGKFVIVDLYNHGKHSMHLSDVEYNQYADKQDEDDWYDNEELNEFAQFLLPAAMVATTPVRGFAAGLPDNPLDLLPESDNPKLNALIKNIQARVPKAAVKRPEIMQRVAQMVTQADPAVHDAMATAQQLVQQYGQGAPAPAQTNVNDLKAQARSGNVLAQLPKTSSGSPSYAQQHATFEGWSNKMVARRTGQAPTPYSVYVNGREWKSFADDDHAENVANKLRARFKQEGKDPGVITIAPTGYDKGVAEGQLDELSPETLKSYLKKSKNHSQKYDQLGNKADDKGDEALANKMWNKGDNRYAGAEQARVKLADLKDKKKGVAEDWIDDDAAEPLARYFADLYYGDFSATYKVKLTSHIYQAIQNGELSIEQLKADIDMLEKEKGIKEFAPTPVPSDNDDLSTEAQKDGFRIGASSVDGMPLDQAFGYTHWDEKYKLAFSSGWVKGRQFKIKNAKNDGVDLVLQKNGSLARAQGVAEADETSWTANSAKFGDGYDDWPVAPQVVKFFTQKLLKAGHSAEELSKLSDMEIASLYRKLDEETRGIDDPARVRELSKQAWERTHAKGKNAFDRFATRMSARALDNVKIDRKTGKVVDEDQTKFVRTHKPNCGWNFGHDCDCGGTLAHARDCGHRYGHDCDCGLDQAKQVKEFAPTGNYKPPIIPREPGKDPFEDDPRSQTVSKVQQLLDAGKSVFVLLPGARGRAIGTQIRDDHSWLNVQYKGWKDPKTRSNARLTVNLKAEDDASLTLTPGSQFTDNKDRPFDYTLSGQANTGRGLGMFGMEEAANSAQQAAIAIAKKKEQGVAEAETDYSRRRQRERDVDAGRPVAKQRQPKMTDYQKRRAQDKKDMELGEDQDTSGVESAIIRRIMIAHTDLLMKFGPEKVMQAAEEVAYNVGDVDEIGTSDVSAYIEQVKQILGAV